MKFHNYLMAGFCAVALTACGGGSGGGDDDDNGGGSTGGDGTTEPPAQAFNRDHLDSINATVAQLAGFTGEGVRVAFLDSGVYAGHEAFAGRNIAGFDAVANNGDRTYQGNALTDEGGHGTTVASLIGGTQVGVATAVDLSSYKVFTSDSAGDESFRQRDAIEALEEAVSAGGIDIINMSFDVSFTPDINTQPERDAVIAGIAQDDWIVVTSAGNSGGGNAVAGANYADDPAFSGHILAVGSVNDNNQLSSFSATATSPTDLDSRFGNNAGVIEHFIVAPGSSVCGAASSQFTGASCNPGADSGSLAATESYMNQNGTSFAAPLVSGAAALIKGAYPSLGGAEVVQILLDSATDLGDPGVDGVFGAGLLNVQAALELAEERATSAADGNDSTP